MASIYDKIPQGFFNLLGSNANSRIYAACLVELYDQNEDSPCFTMTLDDALQIIGLFLHRNDWVLEDNVLNKDKPDYHDMAWQIVNKMSKPENGWLRRETDESFQTVITLTPAGTKLAAFLKELDGDVPSVSLENYAGDIDSALSNESEWDQYPYANGLVKVYTSAMNLKHDLKNLSTNLENHMDKMIRRQELSQVVNNMIAFCSGNFSADYQRLKDRKNDCQW